MKQITRKRVADDDYRLDEPVVGSQETLGFFYRRWTKEIYKWYCGVLPKGKRFNKYIKGKKYKKYDKELVNIISKHFECGKLQTKDYLELIDKEELKVILEMYGLDKKTMKRLLKWVT